MNWASHWRFIAGLNNLVLLHKPENVKAIIEWGAGTSTILLFNLADTLKARFVTVEEHDTYLTTVTQALNRSHGLLSEHAVAVFGPEELTGSDRRKWCYPTVPLHYQQNFDIMFVDGRCRAECLLVSNLIASKNAITILHDFYRVRYSVARYLFEIVDEYMGAQVLKRKREFDFLSKSLFEVLKNHQNVEIIAKDYLFQDDQTMSNDEIKILTVLVKKHFKKNVKESILEWSDGRSTEAILDLFKKHMLNIFVSIHKYPEETTFLKDKYRNNGNIKIKEVSIIGQRGDCSRDPNFHYSSAPVFYRRTYDCIYVGANRRNECLMTSAFLLTPNGRLILRDYDLPHYTVGKQFFNKVDELGNFGVYELRKEMIGKTEGLFDYFDKHHEEAEISQAQTLEERKREKEKIEKFLKK